MGEGTREEQAPGLELLMAAEALRPWALRAVEMTVYMAGQRTVLVAATVRLVFPAVGERT